MLPWLRELTGIKLSDTIDMTCSKYEYTGVSCDQMSCDCMLLDTLLCHDDQLEGRRVAFMYYLVDSSWSSQDGGVI